ncbi:MAG: hypothetical protein Q9223_004981 [Gallowayella weberi]
MSDLAPYEHHNFLASGWVFDSYPDPGSQLEGTWEKAFKLLPGKPGLQDILSVSMEHKEPYRFGRNQVEDPTGAYCYAGMILRSGFIIVKDAKHTVESRLEERYEGWEGKEQTAKRLPQLHRLSDTLWEAWKQVPKPIGNPNPENLRYFAFDYVNSTKSSTFIRETFITWYGTFEVPWKYRLSFDANSDEGRRLLDLQPSLAVRQLMDQRAAELGGGTLMVTIFTRPSVRQCMIWELVPQGQRSTFAI